MTNPISLFPVFTRDMAYPPDPGWYTDPDSTVGEADGPEDDNKDVSMKRPTVWVMGGGTDPIVRITFTNASDVHHLKLFKADTADADDADWTQVGSDITKPDPVSDPYVQATDTGQGFTDVTYYRAAQYATSDVYASPWSNVVKNTTNTFLFELRDTEGFLRGVQFNVNTANSSLGPTWAEAMETMVACHSKLIELLKRHLSDADIDLVWASPPSDLVDYVSSMVARNVLARAELNSDTRKERIALANDTMRDSLREFYQDRMVRLSNGEIITFDAPGIGAG